MMSLMIIGCNVERIQVTKDPLWLCNQCTDSTSSPKMGISGHVKEWIVVYDKKWVAHTCPFCQTKQNYLQVHFLRQYQLAYN